MAYSIISTVGNGTSQYAISFTLGFNSRTEVKCRVNNEVDGLGDPVYKDLTWINDGLVEVADGPYTGADDLVFSRTVDKTELIHDYSNGEPIEELNLDESNKQNLMAIHEVLDGRLESPLANDLDMGGFRIINLGDGVDPEDAANLEQLDTVLDAVPNMATIVANIAAINAVAAIDDNISTVAAIDNDVTTVALIASDVNDVANIQTEVVSVAGIAADISAVALIDNDIETVVDNIVDIQNAEENAAIAVNAAASGAGLRNLIINGAMEIAQENEANAVVLSAGSSSYVVDQWLCRMNGVELAVSGQRSTDAPPGFINSLLLTVTNPETAVGSGEYIYVRQPLEGRDVNNLAYGTANAVPVSASFWVKSSITGTFGFQLANGAQNRTIVKPFTISSANTWEYKTIDNIVGDTTGTWPTDNTLAMYAMITVAYGSNTTSSTVWQAGFFAAPTGQSTAHMTTNGSTFAISAVNLVPSLTAKTFERRPPTLERTLARRFVYKTFPEGTAPAQNAGVAGAFMTQSYVAATVLGGYIAFPVEMRVAPTVTTTYNPSAANANWRDITAAADRTRTIGTASTTGIYITGAAGAAGSTNLIHGMFKCQM